MQKKISLIINILFLLFIILYSGICIAEVGGECDSCHALYPGMTEKPSLVKPFTYVNREIFCINCHSHNTSDTIKTIGGNKVPVVFSNIKPVYPLAGGNFYYVARDFSDRKGHNVNGITSRDLKFTGFPPGYNRAFDPSIRGYNPGKPLACAGSNGCHGDRDIEDPFEAIYGTHHAVDKPLDGSTTARSYRYLKNSGRVKGVTGLEDSEWNRNGTSNRHNEYSPSIDGFCESCHGDFHNKDKTGKNGAWFRHPTGIPLPNKGEYTAYNIYNLDAPVSRETLPKKPGDVVVTGKDTVTCLSCHMVHSSPYASVLRWDYDDIFTGEEGKGGCLICHTGK